MTDSAPFEAQSIDVAGLTAEELEREGLRLALEHERAYSEALRAELRERRRELRAARCTVLEQRLALIKQPESSPPNPDAAAPARPNDSAVSVIDDIVQSLRTELEALPSRTEELESREWLPLALEEPPVPQFPLAAGPIARPDVRFATVLDEFTRLAFTYEVALTDLHPDRWREQMADEPPDVLLVESAWRGTANAWAHKVSNPRHGDIAELVAWCKQAGVPTIFWNKEDPANFDRFCHNAPLFDHVLTTDIDCVERYREMVGHDRVGVMPFAAQPRIHTPCRVPGGRSRSVAFAGTYYRDKHPNRKVQMQAVLDPARVFGLEIFSRVADHPAFQFPELYQRHIVGSLAYADLMTAHRMYRVFLNVNSVVASGTMCARRIFELLAAGATVVSGVSPAIQDLLGPGLVWESEDPEVTVSMLEQILGDDEARERHAVGALRTVLDEHTYGDRVAHVCRLAGLSVPESRPSLAVVSLLSDEGDATALRATLERQRHQPAAVTVILAGIQAELAVSALAPLGAELRVINASRGDPDGPLYDRALAEASTEFVALMDPAAFYAEHYLGDAVQAFAYADADIVGKAVIHDVATGVPLIEGARTREYDYVPMLHDATLVIRSDRAANVRWRAVSSSAATLFQWDARRAGLRLFSTDRFNFVAAPRDGERHSMREAELGAAIA